MGDTMGKNIILCGFMGSGKTRIGKLLSKETGRSFIDIDRYIEQQESMTITSIFEKYGEASFRRKENKAVKLLSGKEDLIIACGGGTVMNRENVDAFHIGEGLIVFLNVPVVVLQDRLKNDKKRPLLQTADRNQVIRRLYKERYHKYKAAADLSIYAALPAKLVTKRILSKRVVKSIL